MFIKISSGALSNRFPVIKKRRREKKECNRHLNSLFFITRLPREGNKVDLFFFEASVTVIVPSEWALWHTESVTDTSPAVLAAFDPFVTNRLPADRLLVVRELGDNSCLFEAVAVQIRLFQIKEFWVSSTGSHAGAASVSDVLIWAGSCNEWKGLSFGLRVSGEVGVVVRNGGAVSVDRLASLHGSAKRQTARLDGITLNLVQVLVLQEQRVQIDTLLDTFSQVEGPVFDIFFNLGGFFNFAEGRHQAGEFFVSGLSNEEGFKSRLVAFDVSEAKDQCNRKKNSHRRRR